MTPSLPARQPGLSPVGPRTPRLAPAGQWNAAVTPTRAQSSRLGVDALAERSLRLAAVILLGLAAVLARGPGEARADDGDSGGRTAVPEAHLIPNCARTGGGIAIAEAQGRIYYCLQRVVAIERRYPSASKFFFLHEYGHIALQSGDELLVDCWSAHELSHTVRGEEVLGAARRYIEQFKLFIQKYGGTGADRSELLQGCYDEGLDWLERARTEGRRPPPLAAGSRQ